MPTLDPETGRFSLPARIRVKGYPADGNGCHWRLADRIAEMPFIHTVEDGEGTLPHRINVFVETPARTGRKQHAHRLLCRISADGIAVCGLPEWDRYQVIAGGWGRLQGDRALLYLPRDEAEFAVCLSLLQRAYAVLTDSSPMPPPTRSGERGLPNFSRTTLQ